MLNGAAPKPCPECGAEREVVFCSTLQHGSTRLSFQDPSKFSTMMMGIKQFATVDKAVACLQCGLVTFYSSNISQLRDNPEK